MWKKRCFIFSEEVSLHITPVYHSFTEWESGKDPWVLLLRHFCCLVIVINETKCPESVLRVLLLFVGALSCPDPAECAETKSKNQNARTTSSSSRAQGILPGENGNFHRERCNGSQTQLSLRHFSQLRRLTVFETKTMTKTCQQWHVRLWQHPCGSNLISKVIACSGHPAQGRRNRTFESEPAEGQQGLGVFSGNHLRQAPTQGRAVPAPRWASLECQDRTSSLWPCLRIQLF